MNKYTENNIIWSILDAKKLVPSDWNLFWKSWNNYAGPSYIQKPDPAGNRDSEYLITGKRTEYFNGLNIYCKDKNVIKNGHWSLPYLNYKDIFPNVLNDLHNNFPWVKNFYVCRLWMSSRDIPLHRDHTLEDLALRAMIYDENEKSTFKVHHEEKGTSYIHLNNETNCFVYNNKTCLHGSDKIEGFNKIILLTVYSVKDRNLMLEHIKNSSEKYQDKCQFVK